MFNSSKEFVQTRIEPIPEGKKVTNLGSTVKKINKGESKAETEDEVDLIPVELNYAH